MIIDKYPGRASISLVVALVTILFLDSLPVILLTNSPFSLILTWVVLGLIWASRLLRRQLTALNPPPVVKPTASIHFRIHGCQKSLVRMSPTPRVSLIKRFQFQSSERNSTRSMFFVFLGHGTLEKFDQLLSSLPHRSDDLWRLTYSYFRITTSPHHHLEQGAGNRESWYGLAISPPLDRLGSQPRSITTQT